MWSLVEDDDDDDADHNTRVNTVWFNDHSTIHCDFIDQLLDHSLTNKSKEISPLGCPYSSL